MTSLTRPPRILLLITCLIVFIVSSAAYLNRPELPASISLDTKGQPTIGYSKALVHVVVFEEPKCSHCRDFNNEIFPVLKKEFVDTNKIRYTAIPVSFMPGSMPAAVASLCIYYENPNYPNDELFFKYFDSMYHNQSNNNIDWATTDRLVALAKSTSPAIQLDQLKMGIEKEAYRIQIERNTKYGAEVMGGTIITPTVYVNGIKVEELSLDNLTDLINKILEHEGVN